VTKIVFFGNEQLAGGLEIPATPIFDTLAASGYDMAVLVLPRTPKSTFRQQTELAIITAAEANNVPIIYADQEADLNKTLRQIGADVGVLASYGKIVRQSTIDAFPQGIVNIHPSILPKYRGSTPLEAAILNGDLETGVSLMALTAKMDAGPIYAQTKITLSGHESKQELYERLADLGAKLLTQNLPKIVSDEPTPTPQDEAAATYTKQTSKTDDALTPETMTATECERRVRAYLNWPKTRLSFLGQKVIVTQARVLENYAGDDWPDVVKCADDTYLQIVELVNPKSGKTMKTADYLRGLK
jgi:methionyl-tRNA formyltransferase